MASHRKARRTPLATTVLAALIAGMTLAGNPALASKGYDTSGLAQTNGPQEHARADRLTPPRQIQLRQPGSYTSAVAQQLREFYSSPLQSTGYWVEANQTLIVDVETTHALPRPAPELWVSTPNDSTRFFNKAQKVSLSAGRNTITTTRAGIIYLASYHPPTGDIRIKLQSGGRPFPRFVLGEHTNADWAKLLDKFDDSPYVEFVSPHMMITVRRERAVQHLDSAGPESMLQTWDKIVGWAEDQYGLIDDRDGDSLHRRNKHRFHWVDGLPAIAPDECGGYMNTWDYRMQACWEEESTGRYSIRDVINGEQLKRNSWGAWHELGHLFQMWPYTWRGLGEVTVNLTSLYVQRELGQLSGLESDDAKGWKNIFDYLARDHRHFNDPNLSEWIKIGMFWQLDLTFGKDFYARLGKRYRGMPQESLPGSNDEQAQRFILEASRVAGYDLSAFFDQWGLPATSDTRQRISDLGLPEMTDPIWENRDSDVKYNYAHAAPNPAPVAHAGGDWKVVATSNWGYAYALDGRASTGENLSYQWRIVSGTFGLRKGDQAKAEAIVPKNATGTTVYELKVTDKKTGKAATATAKVIAVAPEASIAGNSNVVAGRAAAFSAASNFGGGTMSYQWTLRNAADALVDSGNGKRWTTRRDLAAGNYTAHVVVHSTAGERRASAAHQLKVTAGEGGNEGGDGAQYPRYVAGAASQLPGRIVTSRDGKLYQCKAAPYGDWCRVNSAIHYEPGFGLNWRDAWALYRK